MLNVSTKLNKARESSGVTIEEASKDLNIKEVILENLESGNIGGFKDIFELKGWIVSYAKYLGLNEEELIDEFNEYMFEYTSKIPVKEIEKKIKELNKEKESEVKVVSPYTNPTIKDSKKSYVIIYIIILLLVILVIIWSAKQVA